MDVWLMRLLYGLIYPTFCHSSEVMSIMNLWLFPQCRHINYPAISAYQMKSLKDYNGNCIHHPYPSYSMTIPRREDLRKKLCLYWLFLFLFFFFRCNHGRYFIPFWTSNFRLSPNFLLQKNHPIRNKKIF